MLDVILGLDAMCLPCPLADCHRVFGAGSQEGAGIGITASSIGHDTSSGDEMSVFRVDVGPIVSGCAERDRGKTSEAWTPVGVVDTAVIGFGRCPAQICSEAKQGAPGASRILNSIPIHLEGAKRIV